TLADLKKYMVTAARKQDVKLTSRWTEGSSDRKFELSIKYVPQEFSFEWTFSEKKGLKVQRIWTRTSDIAEEIHTIIEATLKLSESELLDTSLDRKWEQMSSTRRAHASRLLEQTFDRVPIEQLQEMSLAPEALSGNLQIIHITNLLQSISMGHLSGRLRINRQAAYADMFFIEGKAVHAEGSRAHGEECFVQVICWKDGEFQFEPKLKTDERTVSRPMDMLILEGVLLLDNTEYLKQCGVNMDTVLERVNKDLSENQFVEIVSKAEPPDMQLAKDIYLQIDGRKTIQDLVDLLRLNRSRWVPTLATLVRSRVAQICHAPPKKLEVKPKKLDPALMRAVTRSLEHEKTGLYSYPAFLFFLNHELYFSSERPVSIILFGLRSTGEKAVDTSPLLRELSRSIQNTQGAKGIISHYEEYDLALTLIGATASQAAVVADRVIKSLMSSSMEFQIANMNMAQGIASFPDDADDAPTLLAAAELARDTALNEGRHRTILARDLV
ncbi:MAG: DUF4388 domain-containing protein, partial [Cyanobacteria bacterium]|nr:DUF4388 domain-containing protein [Cyanobacteriota bacterium]